MEPREAARRPVRTASTVRDAGRGRATASRLWALQEPLNFPLTAYGMERLRGGGVDMVKLTGRLAAASACHRDDRIVE